MPVADLLIAPDQFPAPYRATVLDHTAVYRALQDVAGVPPGAVVTPPECTPEPLDAQHTAAVEGVDSRSSGSLIVAVTRPAPPLRAGRLRACSSFTAAHGAEVWAIRSTVLPAPPVDADEQLAVDQTVTTSRSVRRTLTLTAQIGDTRVSATWRRADADPGAVEALDAGVLDPLFRDAVLKVRRLG